MKYYRVTFNTTRNGYRNWIIDITASNLKEAKAKAQEMWSKKSDAHMFRIETRLLKDNEEYLYNYFVKVER